MGNIIQGIDLLEVLFRIMKKSKRYQRAILERLEAVLGKDDERYEQVRKLFLDNWNEYTREIFREIFGDDLESMVK